MCFCSIFKNQLEKIFDNFFKQELSVKVKKNGYDYLTLLEYFNDFFTLFQ